MPDELIPIRLSHLLGHSGVGAIVRGAKGLVVVQDIRQWTNRQDNPAGKPIPYVERVRAALGIRQQLRQPPVAKELANKQVDGVCVPAMRFPSWMRCPTCGALYYRPWRNHQSDTVPRCKQQDCKRKPQLEQMTWVLVHPQGYLADVPWHFLAHNMKDARNPEDARNPAQRNCKVRDQLRLIEQGYKRTLSCDACKAQTLFDGKEWVPFPYGRMQPWTKQDMVPSVEVPDTGGQQVAQVLSVNDTRVYAPVSDSALVIPPESRVRKGTVVDRLYRNSDDRRRIDTAPTELARKSIIRGLATDYRCTSGDIETALADLASGYPLYGDNPTPGQLRESEFNAFLEVLPDQREDEDLVTHNKSDEWRELVTSGELDTDKRKIAQGIRHLVRVDRLKAVKVFRGFKRPGREPKVPSRLVPPDILGASDWLPAVELYGEGIFLTLDEDRLKTWEQNPAVTARLHQLQPRFEQFGSNAPSSLEARFMLLHTLSHLLLRQIESEGGYPAAALLERIYCATAPEPMAGILIHVAVPDIAGSLGGLAELAEPRRFLGILIRTLERSLWCSLDPVCSEHEGQGPGLLNRAACHACALVPEPACEYGNTLLDRGFVKNAATNGLPAYFGMP